MAGLFLWFSLKKPNPQFWSSSSLTVGRIFFAILIQRSGELVLKYATNIYSHTVPSASATRHTSPIRWFSWPVAVHYPLVRLHRRYPNAHVRTPPPPFQALLGIRHSLEVWSCGKSAAFDRHCGDMTLIWWGEEGQYIPRNWYYLT